MQKENRWERQTWYGLKATIILGPGFLHSSGFGRVLFPHPPLVNWMLRLGLKGDTQKILSFAHEFGHLQTAPLALIYFGAILSLALNLGPRSPVQILFLLASAQAAWEIASESLAITSDTNFYRKAYKGIRMTPRAVFWVLTSALTIGGWFVATG